MDDLTPKLFFNSLKKELSSIISGFGLDGSHYPIKYEKKRILSFLNLLGSFYNTNQIITLQEKNRINQLELEIKVRVTQLEEKYDKIDNESHHGAEDELNLDFDKNKNDLKNKLVNLLQILEMIFENYEKKLKTETSEFFNNNPCMTPLASMQDYNEFISLRNSEAFYSEELNFIKKSIFPILNKQMLNIKQLKLLTQQVQDKNTFNLLKRNILLYKHNFTNVEESIRSIEFLDIFFRPYLFDALALWRDLIYPARFKLIGRMFWHEKLKPHILFKFGRRVDEEYLESIRELVNIGITVETDAFLSYPDRLKPINKGIIRLLAISNIKIITGSGDIDKLNELSEIIGKNPASSSRIDQIAKCYMTLVENLTNDINFLHIFIKAVNILGIERFLAIQKEGIVLDSPSLIELDMMIKNPSNTSWEEFIQKIKDDSSNNKKVVVYALPYSDHNLASEDSFDEIKKIQGDKYAVYIFRINSYLKLGEAIRSVAKKRRIDILIIQGHGDNRGTTFTERRHNKSEVYEKGYLDKKTVYNSAFKDINLCFNKNAICYMFSCSTGKGPDPIANDLAKVFGVEVVAPQTDTGAKIGINEHGEIEAKYKEGTPLARFGHDRFI